MTAVPLAATALFKLGHALSFSFGMFWEILWALILGFALSGAVQAPMGLGPERHDTHSYETHVRRWLGFRQPVQRVAMERTGHQITHTYEANPGEVWEEGEFWIEVSWRADPDGSLGIRRYYESPYRPAEKITLEEYYRWMFENTVPGLPEKAGEQGLTPLQYMRRQGCSRLRATSNVSTKPRSRPTSARLRSAAASARSRRSISTGRTCR